MPHTVDETADESPTDMSDSISWPWSSLTKLVQWHPTASLFPASPHELIPVEHWNWNSNWDDGIIDPAPSVPACK
jgi:hypothetical protein